MTLANLGPATLRVAPSPWRLGGPMRVDKRATPDCVEDRHRFVSGAGRCDSVIRLLKMCRSLLVSFDPTSVHEVFRG
jgi:hypothetical protein